MKFLSTLRRFLRGKEKIDTYFGKRSAGLIVRYFSHYFFLNLQKMWNKKILAITLSHFRKFPPLAMKISSHNPFLGPFFVMEWFSVFLSARRIPLLLPWKNRTQMGFGYKKILSISPLPVSFYLILYIRMNFQAGLTLYCGGP